MTKSDSTSFLSSVQSHYGFMLLAQGPDGDQASEVADVATGWRFWKKKRPLRQRFKEGIQGGVKQRHRHRVVILGETRGTQRPLQLWRETFSSATASPASLVAEGPKDLQACPLSVSCTIIPRLPRASINSRDTLEETLLEVDFGRQGSEGGCARLNRHQVLIAHCGGLPSP